MGTKKRKKKKKRRRENMKEKKKKNATQAEGVLKAGMELFHIVGPQAGYFSDIVLFRVVPDKTSGRLFLKRGEC